MGASASGGTARTNDGRGPYRVVSPQSIISASMGGAKKLPLDEAHATDKGALLGLAHPARGWIVELQSREMAFGAASIGTPRAAR
jgi:hypothetical protein